MKDILYEDQTKITVLRHTASTCQHSLLGQPARTTLGRNPVPTWASSSPARNLKSRAKIRNRNGRDPKANPDLASTSGGGKRWWKIGEGQV